MGQNKKDKEEIKRRIMEEEDFIYCPRLSNSLDKLVEKNPSGVEDKRVAKVLLMDESEMQKWYQGALDKLRKILQGKT